MKEDRSLTRNASLIGSATMLSRLLGMARDILTASYFGTGPAMSAFVAAFTIPNLFRKLFGEGALTGAFIPVFTEYLEREKRRRAWQMASIILSLLMVFLAVLVAIGLIVTGLISREVAGEYYLTIRLLRVMLPYLFFVCLTGLLGAVLNSLRHFALPAAAPVLLNLAWIGALLFLCPRFGGRPEEKIYGLALGVVIGGVIQAGAQLPGLRKKGFRFRFRLDLHHPAVKRIVYLLGPALLGMGLIQLNVVVDRFLAFLIGPEAPATLYFANRLVQLPLGVFGIALATAVLPLFSSQAASRRREDYKKTLAYSLRMISVVSVPAAVGLIVLRRPIIQLLFQRNSFGPASTSATAWVLLFYALGLPAFAALKIMVQAFYSRQDTRTPVKVAAAAMFLNLGLNLLVVFNPWLKAHLREGGLALSTSIAAFLNLGLLAYLLRRRIGPLRGPEIASSLGKIVPASLVMGVSCYLSLCWWARHFSSPGLLTRIGGVFGPILISLIVFWLVAKLIKIPEIGELKQAFYQGSRDQYL